MDYQKELETVKAGGNFWKPKTGQFKVKALSELIPTEPFVREHETGEKEISEQVKLIIEVQGEQKDWTFGKGKTPASTYGQILELAVKKGNALTGVEFSVVVTSDGKKNNYTIVH